MLSKSLNRNGKYIQHGPTIELETKRITLGYHECTHWAAGRDSIFKGFHTSDNRYVQVGQLRVVQVW